MRRSPRFVIASCTAVVVAAGTAFTVGNDLNALHHRAREFGALRTVLVATRAVPLGAVLHEDDIEVVRRHTAAVPDDAIEGNAEAVGEVLRVPLVPGAVVQRAHLASDGTGLTGAVPFGYRAVRVETVDGSRPDPGTVVDILAALDPSISTAASGAIPVARGALVLAADGTDAPTPGAGTGGVTLLVTEEEAYDLAFAAANGVLTLAVAPPEAACCPSDS